MDDTMTKRQRQVAIAAGPVFLRQGFVRTTMGDIAAAAGLSRQGLYLAFPNKEAVFAAAVLVLTEQQDAELEEGLCHIRGLRSRLIFVCERWLRGVFDLQRSTPDARDMDDLIFPVVREVYRRFVARIALLIEVESGDALGAIAITDLARLLVFGIRGYSNSAKDGPDMRRLVELQVDLIVGHVEAAMRARPVASKQKLRA
ncbi:MAG: TetR/AcrR family transcriptional regulator [Sphingomonadaceae bacterium]|nr:TetR/AcrR family transcriptional regulator [Sphingomonadaceae bacterium]